MRLLTVCACLLASACAPGLAERYEAGNQALSSGDGLMYSVVIAPVLQEALNTCIPEGTDGAAAILMILADIGENGLARNVVVQPDSAGSACVRARIEESRFHRPPLRAGQEQFPIGLRVEQGR